VFRDARRAALRLVLDDAMNFSPGVKRSADPRDADLGIVNAMLQELEGVHGAHRRVVI